MLKTMTGESATPEPANVRLDYILHDDDRLKADEIAHAGYAYMNFLDEAERGDVEIREHETLTSVTIGRKVMEVMAYAELDHEADLMREGVEAIATRFGVAEAMARGYAGTVISGRLSERD